MSQDNKMQQSAQVAGVDLTGIRNRNERRVIARMKTLLKEHPDFEPDILAIQDIYALSLNLLPARYTQKFAIVLQEPVDDEAVRIAVEKAIEKVQANPTDQSQYQENV